MPRVRLTLAFLLVGVLGHALELGADDVFLEAREQGLFLFIRQKPGIASVLLTESMELPDNSVATYALRALEPNDVNGNERRLLNGQFLPDGHLSLIDSTPEFVPRFGGPGFVILMPPEIQYGWPNNPAARYGRHNLRELIQEGRPPYWFSIRTFAKPYADYTGPWRDNPFEIKAMHQQQYQAPAAAQPEPPPTPQEPPPPSVDGSRFHPKIRTSFEALSRSVRPSESGQPLIDAIIGILRSYRGPDIEIVLAIDTTGSMRPHIQFLRERLIPAMRAELERFSTFRIGLVLYRDYMEEYLTRSYPFRNDWDSFARDLRAITVSGGGDLPEAVVEGLHAAASYPFHSAQRVIVLIGDAPAHDIPRGRITREMLQALVREKAVDIHAIMLPNR